MVKCKTFTKFILLIFPEIYGVIGIHKQVKVSAFLSFRVTLIVPEEPLFRYFRVQN